MYLVVITKKKKVGDLLGHAVWKALEFDIISYKKTILHLTDNQVQTRINTLHVEKTDQITTHCILRSAVSCTVL